MIPNFRQSTIKITLTNNIGKEKKGNNTTIIKPTTKLAKFTYVGKQKGHQIFKKQ